MTKFAIYRILGNDLPPRHRAGQTYENLCFVLDQEPAFDQCEKHWILNRIADPRQEQRLLDLLESRGQSYLRVPFLFEEYRACVDKPVRPESRWPKDNETQPALHRHNKVLYAMNNNGARNLALRQGRRHADWVLPLDGNCCFDQEGWNLLTAKVAAQTSADACLAIPMFRLTDNAQYFGFTISGRDQHEPQVILGKDCELEFNENYRYGYLSKMEFLRRLKLNYQCTYSMHIADEDHKCGYVLRLFSGVAEAEGDWTPRTKLREQAIDALLETLDRQAGPFNTSSAQAIDLGNAAELATASNPASV